VNRVDVAQRVSPQDLSTHPISRLEVVFRVRHQLSVAGMIDRLQTDDLGFQPGVVPVNVPDEMELCSRGPHDEHLFRVIESAGNVVKEAVGVVGMLLVAILVRLLPLGVPMDVTTGRVDGRFAERSGQDTVNARLPMIHPDGNMTKAHGVARINLREPTSAAPKLLPA
jgi:hypothetical protein